MNLDLAGRAAIVTGASRGIGAEIARGLAAEGCHVALVARDAAALEGVRAEIAGQRAVHAFAVAGDLSSADGCAAAMEAAIGVLGRVDVLVNNAGSSPFGSFDTVSDADWEAAFALKLMGYIRCIRAVLPAMRAERRGRIVNVVGMAGRYATPGYALGAFNAALLHLTKSVAELTAHEGVRVVALNPALTATERMLDAMRVWAAEAGQPVDEYTRRYVEGLPYGRLVEPREIARLAVFLASEVAEVVSGSALQADATVPEGVF